MIFKIRSNFILKNIFKNLNQKIKLNLIKYNKEIQKKINISIKDYQIYNEIEIEIIPTNKIIGREIFINIEEKYKTNFVIYFDNKIENRNYITDE